MIAPTSSDEIAVLTRMLRDLSPAMREAMARMLIDLTDIDKHARTAMMHVGFQRGKLTKLRVDTDRLELQ